MGAEHRFEVVDDDHIGALGELAHDGSQGFHVRDTPAPCMRFGDVASFLGESRPSLGRPLEIATVKE
jgi:hypothetical protein